MKDPLVFNEEQRDQLRQQTINLLQYWLSKLSLLISTVLFIRCHTIRQFFSKDFQDMASIIGKKLNETPKDKQDQVLEAVFIALRHLNNSDLTPYLSEFAKRTENLSDVLHFNSPIFSRYFIDTISLDSSNTIFLSTMYLTELTFDAQILNMYTVDQQKIDISPKKQLEQLLDDESNGRKIMTFKVATWINDYLQKLNEEKRCHIIKYVSRCLFIERKALSTIKKWIIYRTNPDFIFFAHYAALQLAIEGENITDLIDIILEMFDFDKKLCLKSVVERLFTSRLVNSTFIREFLNALHQNVRHFSKISVWVDRKEILELVLDLELKRIISNMYQPCESSTKPFVLIIKYCSEDLQLYLAEYLHTFVNTHDDIENTVKDEYIAVVSKWIIESSIWSKGSVKFSMILYKNLFALLHDQRFPRVQKAIVGALYSIFINILVLKNNVFMEDDAINNLEKVICFYEKYPEDVVAISLLAYGNYLLKLNIFKSNRNVSDEVLKTLNNIYDKPSSEIIRIRVGYCLIFSEHSNLKFNTISDWFAKKLDMTLETKYKVLLQQSLYLVKNMPFHRYEYDIIGYIEKNLDKLIDTFVFHLYNYLCSTNKNNYLFDPTPNYIDIALKVSKISPKQFYNAVQRSTSFTENNLKNRLSLYCINNRKDNEAAIELYTVFGVLTVELLDMLEWTEDDQFPTLLGCLENLKQVADRDVFEKLLKLPYLNTSKIKLRNCFLVFEALAQSHFVSLSEVYQKISIVNNLPRDTDYESEVGDSEEDIFRLLLHFSCFNTKLLSNFGKIFFTTSDIDEEFERKIENLDKNRNPLLRKLLYR